MSKSIVAEGKTTAEAIENGLKELKTTKSKVDIKILEEDRKSFFSILAPRKVKVELTIREDEVKSKAKEEVKHVEREVRIVDEEDKKLAISNTESFLKAFLGGFEEEMTYIINTEENMLKIDIKGEKAGFLIGHKGESLNGLQDILKCIANKGLKTHIKMILDIEGYKENRKCVIEKRALEKAQKVLAIRRNSMFEPMKAYERKIIHTKLQGMEHIKTISTGEEPYRRVEIKYIK